MSFPRYVGAGTVINIVPRPTNALASGPIILATKSDKKCSENRPPSEKLVKEKKQTGSLVRRNQLNCFSAMKEGRGDLHRKLTRVGGQVRVLNRLGV